MKKSGYRLCIRKFPGNILEIENIHANFKQLASVESKWQNGSKTSDHQTPECSKRCLQAEKL